MEVNQLVQDWKVPGDFHSMSFCIAPYPVLNICRSMEAKSEGCALRILGG